MNHFSTIFSASCFSTQNLPYTSIGNILSKNTSKDFNQLPRERRKSRIFSPDGGVFHVPTSRAILVPFFSLWSKDYASYFTVLEIWILASFKTKSNTNFPTTLPSNFLVSSELSEYVVCPSYSFLVWLQLFLDNSSFGIEAEILRVLEIP